MKLSRELGVEVNLVKLARFRDSRFGGMTSNGSGEISGDLFWERLEVLLNDKGQSFLRPVDSCN
jgi:hypothetical protein